MKFPISKIAVFVILAGFGSVAKGQVYPPSQPVVSIGPVPSGACGPNGIQRNTLTGVIYTCGSGIWGISGGGGSGFPITLGSTSIAGGSTTTSIAGLTLTASPAITLSSGGTLTLTGVANGCASFTSGVLGSTGVACGGGGGSGTVTSVGLTAPSWLTVTGSPITVSGTLALTATTGQTANQFIATPNGTTGAVGLRAIVAADIPTLNQNTTGTAANVTGVVGATNGGTGQSAYALGDTLYSSATNTLARLAGNTTTTKKFLVQTGTGTVSAVPTWGTIAAADVPTLNQNTTGTSAGFTGSLAGDVTGTQSATVVGKLLGNTIPANASGCLANNGSGVLSWSACSAASTTWNTIGNPTGNLSLTMGADTSLFTYNAATGAGVDLFKLTDTASNTGTGALFHVTTASGSAATPWQADANGTGWKVDATGKLVSVGTASPGTITLNGSTSGSAQITVAAVAGTPNPLVLPTATGAANAFLQTNGGSPQQLSWAGTTGTGNVVLAASPTLTGTTTLANLTVTGTCSGCASGSTSTIASGTATLGTTAIASAACATVVTVVASGVATTDAIQFTPNADITAVTGYAPVTTGGLAIYPYPTAGNVNFKVCNPTASSITPGAVTLNWRVVR